MLGVQTQKGTLKDPDINVVMETHGAKVKDKEICNLVWTPSGGKIHQLWMDMGAKILMPVLFLKVRLIFWWQVTPQTFFGSLESTKA